MKLIFDAFNKNAEIAAKLGQRGSSNVNSSSAFLAIKNLHAHRSKLCFEILCDLRKLSPRLPAVVYLFEFDF